MTTRAEVELPPRAPARYFAVSQFGKWARQDASMVRLPLSQCHAKEMGTQATVCGLPCSSWEKFWDLPFTAVRNDWCQVCARAIAQQGK